MTNTKHINERGDSTPVELTPTMSVGYQEQRHYMLKLLHRTLTVQWEHDPELQQKIEKLSDILAAVRWERTRRHLM